MRVARPAWWATAACAMLGSFIVSACAYVLLMVSTVPSDAVPGTYKWLLLKTAPGPRLIVMAGSNAHHAIDAKALGDAFGLVGINVADNGSYAFAERVAALERYAQPADLIVMPLEWRHYTDPSGFNGTYRRDMLTSVPDYFWTATAGRQVQVLVEQPLGTALDILFENAGVSLSGTRTRGALAARLGDLHAAATGPAANGSSAHIATMGLLPRYRNLSCRTFIESETTGLPGLPAAVLALFDRLADLQRRGVSVVLTWPTVTAADCYAEPAHIDAVADEITAAARARGLLVVGRPEDFRLPLPYADNTYYHVLQNGRDIVTARMEAALIAAGIVPRATAPVDVGRAEEAAVAAAEASYPVDAFVPDYPLGIGDTVMAGDVADGRLFWYRGWSSQEAAGRWSNARRSDLLIDAHPPFTLALRAWTFHGPVGVDVAVNGVPVGRMTADRPLEEHLFAVPQGLPGRCCRITLDLQGSVATPALTGFGGDVRALGLFLYAVGVRPAGTALPVATEELPRPPNGRLW